MSIKNNILGIALLFSYSLIAQEILTKKEALAITLANNYGIRIANNDLKVAKNNASIYNSGFLPTVSTSAGANYRRNSQNTIIQSETPIERNIEGAVTKSYNAAVNLNYTIFDGLGRRYNYKQLKERYNLTELQAKATIENTYLQLFTLYFQIARLSENTSNLATILKISKDRLKRAQYRYDYGQSSKLLLLNAEVDVNNDSIAYVNTKQQFTNAKRNLNIILGTKKTSDYDVETEVNFSTILNYENLVAKSKTNNITIQQNKKNLAINEFNIKVNKASYLPRLDLSSSYQWSRSENPQTPFFDPSTTTANGLNAGLNLTWNLFDGGATKTRVANSKIALENQKIALELEEETLQNNLKNTWEDYQNRLFILKVQEQNVVTNQNNFDRTMEQFKLGQINSIEFRQAQLNLLNAKASLNNAKYDAKLLELQLLQLSGDLLNTSF